MASIRTGPPSILVTEALGADSVVFFEVSSPPVVTEERLSAAAPTVTRIAARIPPNRTPKGKERLPLTIDPAQVHWFDPKTGIAI